MPAVANNGLWQWIRTARHGEKPTSCHTGPSDEVAGLLAKARLPAFGLRKSGGRQEIRTAVCETRAVMPVVCAVVKDWSPDEGARRLERHNQLESSSYSLPWGAPPRLAELSAGRASTARPLRGEQLREPMCPDRFSLSSPPSLGRARHNRWGHPQIGAVCVGDRKSPTRYRREGRPKGHSTHPAEQQARTLSTDFY